MKSLVIVVVLCAAVAYSAVTRYPRLGPCKDGEGNIIGDDVEDKTFRLEHEGYCEDCTCMDDGYDVCVLATQYIREIDERCEPLFESCNYRAVLKSDPTADCPYDYKIFTEN